MSIHTLMLGIVGLYLYISHICGLVNAFSIATSQLSTQRGVANWRDPHMPFRRTFLRDSTIVGGLDFSNENLLHNKNQLIDISDSSANSIDKRSDNTFNSLDHSYSSQLDTNIINLQKEDHKLDEVEMHTNNHQLSSNNNNQQQQPNRHYSNYHLTSSNSLSSSSNPAYYNKYNNPPHHNLNLNYIHNLLTKPTSSNSLSNLFNSNSLSSLYNIPMQNGISSSSYYSSQQPLLLSSSNLHPQKSQHHPTTQTTLTQEQQNNNSTSISPLSQSVDFQSSSICGKQQVSAREPRIVGGNNTYEGEFPWAVSIQRHGNHHCGGVIVGRRWILTAAHCVRNQLVGNLIVRTGGHTLTRSINHLTSHLERDHLVEQIVMHDDFSRYDNLTAFQMKSSANTNNADIALLKLKQDIYWNEFAWPVCFPNREAGNFSGHDAVVIGWGKLSEKSEDFSNELQKVKLTIIDNKVCQNWFRQAGRDMPIDDRIICAGFKNGGKDACHGDSGGPLLSKIKGHYVVVGVVSTGIGCARPLLPGLYSRVSSYIGWIEQYVTI